MGSPAKPPKTPKLAPPPTESDKDIQLAARDRKRLEINRSTRRNSLVAGAFQQDNLFGKNTLLGGN